MAYSQMWPMLPNEKSSLEDKARWAAQKGLAARAIKRWRKWMKKSKVHSGGTRAGLDRQ